MKSIRKEDAWEEVRTGAKIETETFGKIRLLFFIWNKWEWGGLRTATIMLL